MKVTFLLSVLEIAARSLRSIVGAVSVPFPCFRMGVGFLFIFGAFLPPRERMFTSGYIRRFFPPCIRIFFWHRAPV